MARIVVVTHAYDEFGPAYLLRRLIPHWRAAGHEVLHSRGIAGLPDADMAFLHIDLSVLPPEYVAACRQQYRVVANGDALDIRKARVSRNLIRPGDGWAGPVIVKTDLNSGGVPEFCAARLGATAEELALVQPLVATNAPYPILQSVADVPSSVWRRNSGLVVERFLPERDESGFYIRIWTFCGARERCTRYRGDHPIVKAANTGARESVPVPETLRREREQLGFDYGKFDFVIHDGQAVLLDANRTPGAPPPPLSAEMERSNAEIAVGIEDLLRMRAA